MPAYIIAMVEVTDPGIFHFGRRTRPAVAHPLPDPPPEYRGRGMTARLAITASHLQYPAHVAACSSFRPPADPRTGAAAGLFDPVGAQASGVDYRNRGPVHRGRLPQRIDESRIGLPGVWFLHGVCLCQAQHPDRL